MMCLKTRVQGLVSSKLISWLLVFSCSLPGVAKAQEVSLEALTAAEDIGILSQSIVKNYFYVGEKLNASRSSKQLAEDIRVIDHSLESLKVSSSYEKIQDDLMFIEVIWADLKETLSQEYSRDTGLLVIDMGEVLLEGSENVTKVLYEGGVKESGMINVIEHQRYLVERMAKLYVISIAGLKDFNVVKQTTNTVEAFDKGLGKIEHKKYPDNITIKVNKLRKRWDSSRDYYLNVQEGDLPKTIFFNTEMIERLLSSIFHYHK